MKRTSSMALFNMPDRRVTRQQVMFIKAIFPFLVLPAELRELIYFFCFSFVGINKVLNNYYKTVKAEGELGNDKPHIPNIKRRAPSILLVNRQIFTEAITLLRKHTITFSHGIFNNKLYNVIKEKPLRQLASIEINDKGHPLLQKPTLNCTWHGYMRLLKGLAEILSKGHHLKSFTLRLDDPSLVEHVTKCAAGGWDCGFRDQLREAVNALKIIRGVKNVTFIGIEHAVAQEVKRRMQSTNMTTFNDLPRAIRNKIYDSAVDWSDASKALASSFAEWQDPRTPFPYPEKSCPTVLLLNKKYGREALAILRSKPLDLMFPGDRTMRVARNLPLLTGFVKMRTLRKVTHLNITLEHWKWAWSLILPFTKIIHECKKLQKVTITIDDGDKYAVLEMPPAPGSTLFPDHPKFRMHTLLQGMTNWGVTGQVPAKFIFPIIYALVANDPKRRQIFPALPPGNTFLGKLVFDGFI